mmetsp:Transcript_31908/g.71859  ORF Transcript_31908/g.71859 Transcript_31908/m.71859 type:complete len:362 (+) Transcript_31908:1583-2668(+)
MRRAGRPLVTRGTPKRGAARGLWAPFGPNSHPPRPASCLASRPASRSGSGPGSGASSAKTEPGDRGSGGSAVSGDGSAARRGVEGSELTDLSLVANDDASLASVLAKSKLLKSPDLDLASELADREGRSSPHNATDRFTPRHPPGTGGGGNSGGGGVGFVTDLSPVVPNASDNDGEEASSSSSSSSGAKPGPKRSGGKATDGASGAASVASAASAASGASGRSSRGGGSEVGSTSEECDEETLLAIRLALSAKYEPLDAPVEFGPGPMGLSFSAFADVHIDSRILAQSSRQPGGLPGGASIVVTAVEPEGTAAAQGVQAGDLILAINGSPLRRGLGKDDFFFMILDLPRPITLSFRKQARA